MATPQQIASQAGSANTAYQMQAARQAYGRKRKPTQVAQQENQALNGLQTTRRQRLENQAVIKATGRARRKKGGNYTAYGQTGGTLAPSGKAGNSHGIAIVNGPSGQARAKNQALHGFVKEQQMQRLKTSANDGLYIDRRPRRKGRKRGRPQYTSGLGY